MAGGKTDRSSKSKPREQMGMKMNKVAYGKGSPLGSDGSGSNKKAPLDNAGIKKGAHASKGMKVNDGHNSPIGKQRPTQDGGPRAGQTKGVDFSITDKISKKDWMRTSKDG